MTIRFSKMHGAGNDFVVVDCLTGAGGDPIEDLTAFARFALDRRFGIGGDQLLLVQAPRRAQRAEGERSQEPSEQADFFMGIRNPDGSTAEMCANGIRAFARYVRTRGLTTKDRLRVETLAGIVTPRLLGDGRVEVEMTVPVLEPAKIPTKLEGPGPLVEVPLEVDGRTLRVTTVSMGNPHCVIFVDDPEREPVETLGPKIEHHAVFPRRTNVEFVAVRSRSQLEQRTWERGTGETLACGSGACAVTVAAILAGRADRELSIQLRGGTLDMRWPDPAGPVWMTGPAEHVFDGELDPKAVEARGANR